MNDTLYPGGIPPSLSDIPPAETIISATTSGTAGWETVLLPFQSFVRTNHGLIVEPQHSLLKNRIKSIGIGLTDRVDGPYDLRIHRIWATNGLSEEEMEEGAEEAMADGGMMSPPIDLAYMGVATIWNNDLGKRFSRGSHTLPMLNPPPPPKDARHHLGYPRTHHQCQTPPCGSAVSTRYARNEAFRGLRVLTRRNLITVNYV